MVIIWKTLFFEIMKIAPSKPSTNLMELSLSVPCYCLYNIFYHLHIMLRHLIAVLINVFSKEYMQNSETCLKKHKKA